MANGLQLIMRCLLAHHEASVCLFSLQVVRACLVAGLYPNVVRVEEGKPKKGGGGGPGGVGGKTGPPKLFAQVQLSNGRSEEQAVQIHPCSVNFNCPRFESPWLVYAEMVSTSAVYLRDCTMVRTICLPSA